MLRSMYSGVSGLRGHQTMMDVIGNNIANVNTTGYKTGTAVFQDLLSQMVRGAGAPIQGGLGGTNPAQIGLGSRLAGISTSFTQGATQLTGRSTDLSISGDGFFMVRQGNENLYSRAGALDFDSLGRMVTPSGGVLRGWNANADGTIDTNAAVGDITIPLGQNIAPRPTDTVQIGGNLDARAATGARITTSIDVYDRQGAPISVSVTFTKDAAANSWTLSAMADVNGDGTATAVPIGGGNPMQFSAATGELTSGAVALNLGANFPGPVALDLGAAGGLDALRQFAGENSVAALGQNGNAVGTLQSFTIGQDGVINGVFSNGRNRPIGAIALATFANPVGLEKVGGSLYRATVNSGLAQVGAAGTNGRGTVVGGSLEMSNVDLAQEFTSLIVAQRGFQANSRVISASDELLQDLVNLKR
jgi:flagellar hook protein FlgE